VALLVVIFVIAIAWAITNAFSGTRILKAYFAIPPDSPVALVVGALVAILAAALAYVALRARH
jgi:ABC-type sulfate transport system permease subunit